MDLLFITQKVDKDDDVLGFVHRWIEELAGHWNKVTVICLYEGIHSLPVNVKVRSLGKENGVSRFKYVWLFYKYIFSEKYDRVLVHMNHEYVVLGGCWWKLCGKKIGMWYSHKSLTMGLRIAVRFANIIFTTARQSVTFTTPKLRFMGHGIDVNAYHCTVRAENKKPVILTVGRVTKIKHCETLIEAAALLKKEGFQCHGVIVGGPATDADRSYEKELRVLVQKLDVKDSVEFTGSIPLDELLAWYCKADISVNMVPTGGFDKSVIEGMAAGNLVMSSNEVFRDHFGAYADKLIFNTGDAVELASKIKALWSASDREKVREFLIHKAGDFDVRALMKSLSDKLQEL